MTKKQLVLIAIMMLCPLLVMLGFFAVLSLEVQKNNQLLLDTIDNRISTIVLGTLKKVQEDVSLILPPSSSPSAPSTKDKKDKIKLDGDASLTTFDGSFFYVNNRLYELGDVVAPYGIVTAIGQDMIVFEDFNGEITVFGQQFASPEPKEESAPLSNPSPAPSKDA